MHHFLCNLFLMSSFAEAQLQKFGWKKGEGLGKNKHGISSAITVGLKQDTNGLGLHSDEWSSTWWDSVFNKTSNTIVVQKDTNGVCLNIFK